VRRSNRSNSDSIGKTIARIGKLVVFAGMDQGARKEFCTAGVAVRLARNWRCLAIDFDSSAGVFRKYLPLNAIDREMPEFLHDRLSSLEALKTKSRISNIDFIEWAGPPDIQTLLPMLSSDSADYVLATLHADASDKAIDLFCAADIPIVVTSPGETALRKIYEFLKQTTSLGRYCGSVYILLNRALQSAEEKETAAWMESVQETIGTRLGFIGAVTYDAQKETNLQLVTPLSGLGPQGVGGSTFEDIALKIERLLPRNNRSPLPKVAKRKTGIIATLVWPFEKNVRLLQEQIRYRDEFISRLQQQNVPPQELMRLAARISELEEDILAHQDEKVELKETIDAVARERDAFRQIEENYRREILKLRDRIGRMEGSSQLQEKTLGILEETISRLKFELMSAIDTKAAKPGPGILLSARDILIQTLRSQPPQSVTLVSIDSAGSATSDFSIEMRSILESAGWVVKFVRSNFDSGQFYGLQVVNDGSEPAMAAARILCNAFKSAGLAFFRRSAPATANLSDFRLIVGRDNWNQKP
jgi:MinD-like ATPase involved in chromosome partitioning or flagellar assembly